jgi:hypothetical protein
MEYSTPHSISSTLSRLEVENILQAYWHVCSRSRLPIELSQTGYVLRRPSKLKDFCMERDTDAKKGWCLFIFGVRC